MDKKALKYVIILLLVPLILSVIIAIATGVNTKSNSGYNSITGTTNYNENSYTPEEQIKSSNAYIYLSIFAFVALGAGVWIYIKKKDAI